MVATSVLKSARNCSFDFLPRPNSLVWKESRLSVVAAESSADERRVTSLTIDLTLSTTVFVSCRLSVRARSCMLANCPRVSCRVICRSMGESPMLERVGGLRSMVGESPMPQQLRRAARTSRRRATRVPLRAGTRRHRDPIGASSRRASAIALR